MLPGIMPVITNHKIQKTWIGSASSTSNLTTYNFGNFTAATDGLMVVLTLLRGANSGRVSSVSIGGTNGTLHYERGTAGNFKYGIASRVVTAGAQAVSVTLTTSNGTSTGSAVGVWLLTDYTSETPSAASAGAVATANSWSYTQTIPSGGVALYGHAHGFNTTGAVTWSGATELADFAATVRFAFADLTGTSGSYTETVSRAGANDAGVLMGAAWQ